MGLSRSGGLRRYHGVQGNRQFFARTLFRVATPVREVTWSDFLLADILTSLAKALSDSERALCHMVAGPVMVPHASQQVQGCRRRFLLPLQGIIKVLTQGGPYSRPSTTLLDLLHMKARGYTISICERVVAHAAQQVLHGFKV